MPKWAKRRADVWEKTLHHGAMTYLVVGETYAPPPEPKAGAFGVFSIVFYGLLGVIAVFLAALFWLDDGTLAAAIAVGSLVVPVTVGFFIAELRHQRAGTLAFVLTAAIVAGAAGAYAFAERDDWVNERNFIAPEVAGVQTAALILD